MNLDTIRDREIRERRRGTVYAALLLLVAVMLIGAIVWSYVR